MVSLLTIKAKKILTWFGKKLVERNDMTKIIAANNTKIV